jgi:hypothetical protein
MCLNLYCNVLVSVVMFVLINGVMYVLVSDVMYVIIRVGNYFKSAAM